MSCKKQWTHDINFVPVTSDNGAPAQKPPRSFRIVSWNTLADQYMRFHSDARSDVDWSVFRECSRHPLLGEVLQHFVDIDVDFICLQEVDFKIARQVLVLQNSYTRLLTPTGHGHGDTRVDACCIFYKPSDWTILRSPEIVNLNDLAGDNPLASNFTRSFIRGNFGIIACFTHRSIPNKRVVICNTHLYWDPEYEYVKLCQAHYLCLRAQEVFFKLHDNDTDTSNFLFCGDLNSQPGGLVHTYLSMGEVMITSQFKRNRTQTTDADRCWNQQAESWLAQESLECPLRHFILESAYAKKDKNERVIGEEISFTNATVDFCGVIDYIFHARASLTQTKRLSFPVLKGERPIIPNKEWPSDHLAIGAEFFSVD